MARYDFYCMNCEVIEIEHPMNEPHPSVCPHCGAPIARFFEPGKAPPIHWVGPGWYANQGPGVQEPTSPEADVPYQ